VGRALECAPAEGDAVDDPQAPAAAGAVAVLADPGGLARPVVDDFEPEDIGLQRCAQDDAALAMGDGVGDELGGDEEAVPERVGTERGREPLGQEFAGELGGLDMARQLNLLDGVGVFSDDGATIATPVAERGIAVRPLTAIGVSATDVAVISVA